MVSDWLKKIFLLRSLLIAFFLIVHSRLNDVNAQVFRRIDDAFANILVKCRNRWSFKILTIGKASL